MVINFYNKNVPDAQFKICWGIEKCTPVFSLNPGGMGSYDLTFSHKIRPGTQCHVYAWSGLREDFDKGLTFVFAKGQRFNATFSCFLNTITQIIHFKKATLAFNTEFSF